MVRVPTDAATNNLNEWNGPLHDLEKITALLGAVMLISLAAKSHRADVAHVPALALLRFVVVCCQQEGGK